VSPGLGLHAPSRLSLPTLHAEALIDCSLDDGIFDQTGRETYLRILNKRNLRITMYANWPKTAHDQPDFRASAGSKVSVSFNVRRYRATEPSVAPTL